MVWAARFVKEWEHQFEPGFPWFVSVARGHALLYVSEHKGDARPDTLIHLDVNDIDAVSEEFGIPIDEEGSSGGSRPHRPRRQSAAHRQPALLTRTPKVIPSAGPRCDDPAIGLR
jgi:hypothetical protein